MLVSGGSTPSAKVGGGGNSDPEIRGGSLQKNIFRPYGPQFDKKLRGDPGPPGPSPGSATANDTPCKKA